MEALRRAEVGVEEPPRYHFAGLHFGDHKLMVGPLEMPTLLGDLGMTRPTKYGLVGGRLDLWTAGAAHASGLDVMDLQVPGGATDLATGIGGD